VEVSGSVLGLWGQSPGSERESSSKEGVGSESKDGGGETMGALGRVKAPDAWIKSDSAEMPFLVPRIVGRDI
jgi:hypothetical protein